MKDNIALETGTAIALALFVGMLTYAQEAWMPGMTTMLVLLGIVVVFGMFSVFVWKEHGGDERDTFIRNIGARTAFLATGLVLVVGIIVETLTSYTPSPWLGGALIVMVGAKIIGHAYGRNKY